ncbi:SAM-dependent methyltransferase [Roseovarius arcticus]|uniref:SAM-dependent methyltransferase n=1 Tax=Roseovarius arcticus TaxID=2547404 RepID=UPI001110C878|nr:class I SAM-dependent methyltransferase [Roseovarius arcticus]
MSAKASIEAGSKTEAINSLDLSCFERDDYLNLLLQRSEVMFDIPKSGQIIKAWNRGNVEPISAVIDDLGIKIAQRAAGVIHAEYLAIEGLLKELKPRRIADIGCGYGFFDLFAAMSLKTEIVLIDLEQNEHRHFGFKDQGAAYSSLKVARQLLVANNVPAADIECVNPRETSPETINPVDLVVSFISCGFHYPVDSYLPTIDKALKPGGAAIFDLRATTESEQVEKLAQFGTVTTIAARPKVHRVLLRKDH